MADGFPDTRHPGSRQDAAAMKIRFAPGVAFVVSAWLIGSLPLAPAHGEVVFGNLGPTGAVGLSSTQTDFGPGAATTYALAQGFRTSAAPTAKLELQSVTIGAFATSTGTLSRTISLYSNVSDNPGTALFTSAPTNVGSNAKYTFSFTGVNLAADTSYWIVPDFSVEWTWVFEQTDFTPPTGQNSSGYTYVGSRRQQQASIGTWEPASPAYSVSVVAVPEPAPFILVAAGAAGLVGLRQRRKVFARRS